MTRSTEARLRRLEEEAGDAPWWHLAGQVPIWRWPAATLAAFLDAFGADSPLAQEAMTSMTDADLSWLAVHGGEDAL